MPVVTLRQESPRQGHFYVPVFEIKIEGVGLPRDILRDVTQLTYRDNIKEIDSFELTVNNWDAQTRTFKYVGAETAASLRGSTPESQRYRLFEPCNKEVEVRMGYLGDLRVILKGNFTTMEPNFPSSGAPTLTVRGLNVLHQLRKKPYTYAWFDKRDSEIAENLATLQDKGKKRFPLPVVTDPKAKHEEPKIPIVSQKNQHDIDFLFSRARERGYVEFVQEEEAIRGIPKRLYFGPSDGSEMPDFRDVTFKLEWGKSLIELKPTLTTANQVKSVTVNGWNRNTRRPISAAVDLQDPKLTKNRDLYGLLNQCDPREEIVVDEPVFTEGEARRRAMAILMDRQKEMVKATATTVGLPDLRAGQRVQIEGLGTRFSGTYFILDTTHTLNDSGYLTRFTARREDGGQGSAA
jgi:phage protein D